jgi:hypothetical protein
LWWSSAWLVAEMYCWTLPYPFVRALVQSGQTYSWSCALLYKFVCQNGCTDPCILTSLLWNHTNNQVYMAFLSILFI